MATYLPRRLAQVQPPGTGVVTAYTVPGGQLCILKQIVIANVIAGSVDATVSVVPAGGVAGVGNRIVPTVTIPAKSVLLFDLSQVMNPGDFVAVQTSAGNAATFTVSGVERTIAQLPASGLHVFREGVPIGMRQRINLHEGTNATLTVVDDPDAGEVDITFGVSLANLAISYVHNQGVAQATWTITHNLGFYPNVVTQDSTGTTVEGDIAYVSLNQLTVTFAGAMSGMAYLS